MNSRNVDYLIIGAGCAGMSLADRFTDYSSQEFSVAILDNKTSFEDNKTWCYWDINGGEGRYEPVKCWDHWTINSDKESFKSEPSTFSYSMNTSKEFYREVLSNLSQHENIQLKLGTTVKRMKPKVGHVEVCTDSDIINAKVVFDSRPIDWRQSLNSSAKPFLLQQFLGWTIETTEFNVDESSVILMDFSIQSKGSISFIYGLPLGENKYLIESTIFSRSLVEKELLAKMIQDYLVKKQVQGYEKIQEECGLIPMSTATPNSSSYHRIQNIGLRGGMARPSSGYTFLNIQRDSDLIIESINTRKSKIDRYRFQEKDLWMDQIMLSLLNDCPELFPEIMTSLFKKCPSDSLVKFMSGIAEIKDYVKVANSMPFKELFIKRTFSNKGQMKEKLNV